MALWYRLRWTPFAVPALMTFASPPLALAVDGAREINQACVATGCFPGDAPGFPVEITDYGQFILTGNLRVTNENTTAIRVQVPNVSIDLGGFVIYGPTRCIGAPMICSPLGSGRGIDLDYLSAAT